MPKFWTRKPELLLLPNLPEPLHGVNPRSVLGSSWWNKERKAAYASTNNTCQACGKHKSEMTGRKVVEGHEVYHTDYEQGQLIYLYTAPLCPTCHRYIHDGRLTAMVETGQISASAYAYTIRHGDSVLQEAGLYRPTRPERHRELLRLREQGKLALWSKWRLVVNNQEYPPQRVPKGCQSVFLP